MGETVTELPYTTYCDAIARETARIAAIAAGSDLAAKVPSCPDWTLADVVRHVGGLQRWFAAMIDRVTPTRLAPEEFDYQLPADVTDYPDWYASGFVEVDKVLRAADPDATMYSWGPDNRVTFWVRRMLMELLVHRHDAELAVDDVTEIDSVLAADGVEEFLVNLPSVAKFSSRVGDLRGDGLTIGFGVWGTEVDWTVRLDPDSFGLTPAVAEPDAIASAETAEALLLLVYGRIGIDDPRIKASGDAALLEKWFKHARF
jgi:uncharacterized protein (TIGR03083 family)